ncbi:DUF3300 domain-containing protein [Alteromonas halophila]|uniref:DUF3300 domain-containing protein n=1 Tax=Alteromonas halophila TaxID=516698 RepID=A0A918MYB5_9ALTE|nr:DUF3300 domain-containing protein [Alteromonas halophila]GGW84378.1 hypothetical protein GCM10007391_17630 [Alteromonas halophila]
MRQVTYLIAVSLMAFGLTPFAQATPAPTTFSVQTTPSAISDAALDSLLAPVALYPDTLLTHILIASTTPLDVIAAHRWRQANPHLTPAQVEQALRNENWHPSIRALAPFTDVLAQMANDLHWLQAMGDAVIADQRRVLDRVQWLRQFAYSQGSLRSNSYLKVSYSGQTIAIVPRHHAQIYVPFYNTRSLFSHWHHHDIQPVYWHYPRHARRHAGIYWSVGVSLSGSFYFGDIHWNNRYVVISHKPVRHWRKGAKSVHSRDFKRWQPQHKKRKRISIRERQRPLVLSHESQRDNHKRVITETTTHRTLAKPVTKTSKLQDRSRVTTKPVAPPAGMSQRTPVVRDTRAQSRQTPTRGKALKQTGRHRAVTTPKVASRER